MIEADRKKHSIRDLILNAKVSQTNLFITAKQGNSKHSNNILVTVAPKYRLDVRTWIINTYCKLKPTNLNKILITISILVQPKIQLEY